MTVWRDLRVEWMRLFRSKGTWLALLGRFRCPLGGLWTLSARRGRYNRGLGSSESHAGRRAGRGRLRLRC